MKKIILSALAAFGLTTAMHAVPAMPGLHTFTQPDGSTVTVQLVGDERAHFYLSEDNYPLLPDAAGRLCYAEIGTDGIVKASSVQAVNTALRIQTHKDLMARADAEDLRQRLASQMSAQSAQRRVAQSGMGLNSTEFPGKGDVHGLAILVEYADVDFMTPNAQDFFYRMLNEEGFSDYGATGSARDFYIDSSNGQFRPTFDVFGPVRLPQNRRYYGGNNIQGSDQNPVQMVIDACKLLDDEIDFSQYDADDDGIIDNVYIFYAGTGEASGGPAESVWPHSWDVFSGGGGTYRFDGKLLNHYACSNEWMIAYSPNRPDGIGTFCHEFGHVLGLPDLYDTVNSGSGNGTGVWATMSGGSYNNESRTPPTFSAYERNALGWLDLDVLDGPASIELDHILLSNHAALIPTPTTTEFYLLENRQPNKWDRYLPAHGMLIWHIDFVQEVFDRNIVNNSATHQYVDIVEAGGRNCPTNAVPYPGARNITSYEPFSWTNQDMNLPVTNIVHQNGLVSFDVCGGVKSIGTPSNLHALPAESTPYSITLQWDAAENANQYLVSVSSGNTSVYTDKSVRGTTCVIDGLQPETMYSFSVKAKAGSMVSTQAATCTAATTDMSFAFMKATTLPATDISTEGFTARWEPLEGATDYEISFSAIVDGRYFTTTADNGMSTPEGWSTSSIKNFTNAGYSGNAVPALRFDDNNGHLTTQLFGDELKTLEFWYRGSANTETNSIEVQFRPDADSEWTTAHSVSPIAATGTTVNVDAPEGSHQGRLLFKRTSNGVLAIDDVVATTLSTTLRDLEGWQGLTTGGATSYDFRITPDMNVRDEFYYTVVGLNEQGHRTLASEPRYVSLSASAGVDNVIETPDAAFRVFGRQIRYCGQAGTLMQVYDSTGRLAGSCTADGDGNAVVTVPAPGFYIAVAAGQSAKALCR